MILPADEVQTRIRFGNDRKIGNDNGRDETQIPFGDDRETRVE